ncbi:GTP cyclohydrolase, FolE2/MptA family, partial [Verrucomicrobia bacterium]|nr:GTP cyclohydrolase, FolE2/MptA family [Verrucomicrobiota bacterium]
RNVVSRLNSDDRISWFQVEAENHESIHNHNAYALISKNQGN